MLNQIHILLLLLILGSSACRKDDQDERDNLLQSTWQLVQIQNTQTNSILSYPGDASAKISVEFTDSLNVVLFNGICNSGNGTYTFSGTNQLSITGLKITLIACRYSEWETYVTQALEEARSYEINGNTLTIFSEGLHNLFFSRNQIR